jgi:type I restriction enzyme M protein
VSTAEAEEEIDLAKVHAQLVDLDQQIKDAAKKHNAFLKELGLPLLP